MASHADPQDSFHNYGLGLLVGVGVYSFIGPRNSQAADVRFGATMISQSRLVSFGIPSPPLRQDPLIRIKTPLDEQYLENTYKRLTLVIAMGDESDSVFSSASIHKKIWNKVIRVGKDHQSPVYWTQKRINVTKL